MNNVAMGPNAVRFFSARFVAWKRRGLSARAASAAALAGCDTIEEIARLGRGYFEGRPNLGPKSLNELEALAGWPPKPHTAVDVITRALLLAISDAEEARGAAADVMSALRRSGFVLTARIKRQHQPEARV